MRYFIFLFVLSEFLQNLKCSSYNEHSGNINISYDLFTCCSEVFGSCRSSCENLSLIELGVVDSNTKDSRLNDVKRFCTPIQMEFWSCMNKTLQAISHGSQWSGRKCCTLTTSPRCQNACATSSSKDKLTHSCRQSDEQHLFSCFERLELGDQCCDNARTSECLRACRDIFEQQTTPSKEHRKFIEKVCDGNNSNSKVFNCIKNFTNLTPISNSKQYLPCCDYSESEKCRLACKNILEISETTQEIIDGLEAGGCGPPLPHDPLWQCFLSAGRKVFIPIGSSEVSQINQVGMDSAKLHCCTKALAPKCRRLCFQTYSNDWTSTRRDLELDCLQQYNEIELRQCIDEVDEPCEAGCDGLPFCSNFNNRPAELFRNCHIHADMAARADVSLWQQKGYISLPELNLPIKNISKCSPGTWRAIACILQIKPCTRNTHTNQICQEDCYEILSECADWTRLENGQTAASVCSKLSPEGDGIPCISLKPYLEPSDVPSNTGSHHKLTSPCRGHPCNATEVCLPNRNESSSYQCLPGCALGEASTYYVPFGAYVRIPVSTSPKACLKICRCSASGKIEHCQPLPCFSYDACMMAGKRMEHGSWFYVECNICSCFAGEITCTKKQCKIPGISDYWYTSLPCNCQPHYVPVCGKNGNTYHSACIAKCIGLQDADFEFGACRSRDPCLEKFHNCPVNTKCVEDRQICLSVMHRPCSQYQCVNITSICSSSEPVCDINGITYSSACHLFNSKSTFAHFGSCFQTCSRAGTVCGINGVTYQNECVAWSDYSLADYFGNCREVGLLASDMGPRCQNIKCPKLPSKHCQGFFPPGACCPICSGAMRIIFSRKQIDRAVYALKGRNLEIVTLKSLVRALDKLIQISECQLSGFLTMETDIFIAVQSREKYPTSIQIDACNREAEKIASLISTQSHRITSNLPLSALTVANIVTTSIHNNSNKNLHFNYYELIFSFIIFFITQMVIK